MFYIAGKTALSYWLDGRLRNYPKIFIPVDHGMDIRYDPILKRALIDFAVTNQLAFPIHVLVSRDNIVHDSKHIKFGVMPQNLPTGSFIKINDIICIASPEATFLLACKNNPKQLLIRFASDLCANYVRDSSLNLKQRFRAPVTSSEKLTAYIKRADNYYGIKAARAVLPFISDHSNSPVETILSALGNLPFNTGGYATGHVCLNDDIVLSEKGSHIFGAKTCSCDASWKGKFVIIEFDSSLAHSDEDQTQWDRNKSSALNASGYTVFNIKFDNLKTVQATDELFLAVREALGLRTRMDVFNKYLEKRIETHRILFKNR